jgi:hypothetical protein
MLFFLLFSYLFFLFKKLNIIDVSKTGNNMSLNLNENEKKRKMNDEMIIDDGPMKKLI